MHSSAGMASRKATLPRRSAVANNRTSSSTPYSASCAQKPLNRVENSCHQSHPVRPLIDKRRTRPQCPNPAFAPVFNPIRTNFPAQEAR